MWENERVVLEGLTDSSGGPSRAAGTSSKTMDSDYNVTVETCVQ